MYYCNAESAYTKFVRYKVKVVATFLTTELKMFQVKYITTFVTYFRNEFHIPTSSDSLYVFIKPLE
jgi:hypothetical protein